MLLTIPEMVVLVQKEARPKLGITVELIVGIWLVESGKRGRDGTWRCNPRAVGDKGKAVGLAQFHKPTWEGLRWPKSWYEPEFVDFPDRREAKVQAMATRLYAMHGRRLLLKAKLPVTPTALARWHNSGRADGKATAYTRKVLRMMELVEKEKKRG